MTPENGLMKHPFEWTSLVARYQEPHRVYHDTGHVQGMLDLARQSGQSAHLDWLEAVIWLHDACHDPSSPHGQNEQRSAALLDGKLGEAFTAEGKKLARAAIEASAHHFQDQTGLHPLIALLLDIDLGGLGGSPAEFKDHTQQVAEEYRRCGMSEEKIIKGHEKFAQNMLARKRIYYSPWMQAHREAKAQANLKQLAQSPEAFT